MKREIKRWLAALMVATVGILVVGAPGFCQEQTYEYGRVVEVDERGEALDYYMEDEYLVEEPDHLPWNPFLSPWMFCLDCLISRAVKISDHYNQMAAERYFAESETCLDIPLGYDPCSTGLRYTLLSPFYAACPDMLVGGGWFNNLKRRAGYGGYGGVAAGYGPYGNYGLSAPIPTVATQGPGGPVLMTPPGAPMAPPPPPGPNGPVILPPVDSTGSAQAAPRVQTAQAGDRWAQMSDAEILAHFGLNSSLATKSTPAERLDAPVAPSADWEYADQSNSTSAMDLMAMAQTAPSTVMSDNPALRQGLPPGAVVVSEKIVDKKKPTAAAEPRIAPGEDFDVDRAMEEVKATEGKKPFSVTDKEYDRLKSIGDSMLDF